MNSANIMVVEDNSTVAHDCRDCLESLGYSVTSIVASGEDSIAKAEEERPDAVLMDIHLRDNLDGIDAAAQIFSRYGIPVVFLSAYSDAELLERAKRVGAFGYLVKPFEERELHATLEMALNKAKSDAAVLAAARMEATATLAKGIAHDYNNLMYIVVGNAELLRSKLGDDHPHADMLREIETAAFRASDLAQRLLAYARGGAFQMESINLNQIIREVLRARELAAPPQIRFVRNLDDFLHNIETDRVHLEMVVSNLILNAIEAIEEGGEITLKTENKLVGEHICRSKPGLNPGHYVLLTVKDTGCGMDQEVLDRVFEPFFSTKFQGRGLGLAAVYGIVKSLSGYVDVESGTGKGTAVRIYLPALGPEEEEVLPPAGDLPKGHETVLVVDDDKVLRRMMPLMLKYLGYNSLTADGSQEALEVARAHEGGIDLVLLDIGMPGLGGPPVFHQLRQELPEAKVIIFTGYEKDESAQTLLEAGAAGYLRKPVTFRQLSETIRKVLDA